MDSTGTTLKFHFPHGIGTAEAGIMAAAIAALIKLNPENLDDADWRFAIEGSPLQAYELGVATATLAGMLDERLKERAK